MDIDILEIKAKLASKFNEISRILKEKAKVKKSFLIEFKEEAFFAGGCIYSLAHNSTPKDYDIFLKSNRLIEELQSLNIWSYATENALTYGNFQIIIKWYGEPENVVSEFDFKHNMYWYDVEKDDLDTVNKVTDEDGFKRYDYMPLLRNTLVFNENRARDIENVYMRVGKFTDRGMVLPAAEKKKIKKKCNKQKLKELRKGKSKSSSSRSHY